MKMETRKNEFDVNIGQKFQSLPQLKQTIPKKNYKPPKEKKQIDFFKVGIIFLLAIGILGFLYLSYDGTYKDSNNQEVSLNPENNIQNEYSFNPLTENLYNFSLLPNYTINIYLGDELLNISN